MVLAHLRSRAWLRFGLTGLLNTVFGYSVFSVLVVAGIWPGAALAATTIVALAFNFQTSQRLVFGSPGRILPFVSVYTVVLVCNWVALRVLQWSGLSALEAQALLTLPAAAMSFIGQQRFVFGSS